MPKTNDTTDKIGDAQVIDRPVEERVSEHSTTHLSTPDNHKVVVTNTVSVVPKVLTFHIDVGREVQRQENIQANARDESSSSGR